MRKLIGSAAALVLLLLFPFLVHATFPSVATGTWSPAQPLTAARSGAATVMLQDGRLLIIGGNNGSASVASVDIVDAAGNITAGPPMNMARAQHTATVLPDGRVLVVGGVDVSGNPIGTAEIFDPSINASQANPWTSTGPLVQARSGQTATLLHDGTVLIAGGASGSQILNTLELFNAASGTNGSFKMLAATLSSPRARHAAALLNDGTVLIIGGWDGTISVPQPPATTGTAHALATTDIYDASAQQVRAGPALNVARMSLTATIQLDGQVFVAGGNDGTQDLASTETFDPTASPQPTSFTPGSLSLTTPRSNHLAFLLPHNGGTLLVGGTSNGTAIATAELYLPVYLSQAETATLVPVANPMSTARAYATGSPLSDGSVTSINDGLLLIAGGTDTSGNTLSSAEILGFPWVKTDALEYSPGTPVNITGGGFQPGETVKLHLQETPYYDAPADMTVVAQADGTFSNSQFAPDTYDINIGFFLTATGSASGRQAQTVFADSQSFDNVTLAFTGSTPGTVSNNLNAGTCAWNGTTSSGSGCSFINVIPNGSSVAFTASSSANWSTTTKGWTFTSGCTAGSTTCTVQTGGNNSGTVNVTFNGTAPQITSADNTSNFTYGEAGTSFTVTATGVPTPTLKVSGAFPSWANFKDNGNGTASISGTPTAAGLSNFTITASNGVGNAATQNFSLTVNKATLTASIVNNPTRPYDGTNNATLTSSNYSLNGLVGSDSFTVTQTTGSYNSANVVSANNVTATLSGSNFTAGTGTSPSNYNLPTSASGPGSITAASVSASIVGNPTRPYDGTTGATLNSSNFKLTGLAGTESFTINQTAGTYNSANVATANTVTASLSASNFTPVNGAQISNYNLPATASGAGTITAVNIAASIVGNPTKPYDGTTSATLNSSNFKLTGLVGTENFSVNQTAGTYNSANVTAASIVTADLAASNFSPASGTLASNYNLPVSASGAGTITAVTLTAAIVGNPSKPYDGTTSATLSSANFKLTGLVGTESFVVNQTAGTYNSANVAAATTVTASLSAANFTPGTGTLTTNYVLPTTASGSGSITAVTLTASIVGDPTKPYDGNTSATLTATNFKLNGLIGSESFTVTQTAGSYNDANVAAANMVTASLSAGNFTAGAGTMASNYNLPTTASGAGSITAVTVTAAIIGTPTKTYDGTTNATLTPANFSLTGLVAGQSFSVTQTMGSYNSANVASATMVTAALASNNFNPGAGTLASNYVLPSTASGPGAISKADATVSVTPYSLTYDGNAHTATGTVTGVGGAALTGLDLTGTAHTNAGTYNDSWTFTDTTGNYNNASGSVSDAIAKANATVNVTPYSVTYDGNAHTATGTVTGVKGEALSGLDLSGTTHTNAQTYSDSWTFTDSTGNYNNASGSVSDAIAKANATINVTPYNVTYDATAHTATGTATGVKGESLSGLDLSGTTHTNAGPYSTDAWTFTDSTGNYNNANGTVSDLIQQAKASITVTPYSATYDATAHTATGSAKGVGGVDLSGDLNLTATTHTNAGTYAADAWSFHDPNGNYADASGTVSDQINQANAVISVKPYNVTYDAGAHTATGTATGIGNIDLSAGLTLTGTTHTNAGTYAADPWSFHDAGGNYADASGTVQDVIQQATASIAVKGYSVTYDGNVHLALGTATGVAGADLSGDLNLTGTAHTSAGTYATDSWTFHDSAGNYADASGTVQDAIARANATVNVVAYNVTYNGNPQTATGTATGVKGESLSGLSLSGTTHTNAGSYTDNWTFTDTTGNYNNASGTVQDVIGKATPTAVSITNIPSGALLNGSFAPMFSVTSTPSGDPGATSVVSSTQNTCTVSSGTVSFISVGQCTLTASVAATMNYNGQTGAAQTFVIGYGFVGLEAPYAGPPTTFNVQRTMPIVWQYTDVKGVVVNSAAANPQIQISGPYACGTTDTAADINVTSAGASGYQYSSTTNTWQFNWQIKGNVPGCYNISIINGQTGQVSGTYPISVVSH